VGSIGKVIGPGGKMIRSLIEEFGLSDLNIGEDGTVSIGGFDSEKLQACKEKVEALVAGDDAGQARRPPYSGKRKQTQKNS